MEFTKSSLVNYIVNLLESQENFSIGVSHIVLNEKTKTAFANVKYHWFLNSTEHYAEHIDSVFKFSEENKEWKSADFWE